MVNCKGIEPCGRQDPGGPPTSQSAEHGRTRRDLARARFKMRGAWHAHLILTGAPSPLGYKYEPPGEPMSSLYTYNGRVQGLIFGVHLDSQQIFLSVQLQRSADWPKREITGAQGDQSFSPHLLPPSTYSLVSCIQCHVFKLRNKPCLVCEWLCN